MADRLICPVCGESNPADMEFCRNCQSRLQPLTGPLKNESGAIQPGEIPTKKVTSELEPLLPQWLRDARQQARETTAEDKTRSEQEQKEAASPSVPDLLDGLASQREEEDEDIPDWLAQITGATSKKKKPASEEKQAKRVELGREPQMPPAGDVSNLPAETPASGTRHAEKDELTDWFKQAAASSETADFRMPPAPYAEPEEPHPSEEPAVPAAPQRPAEDMSWLTNLEARPETPVEPAPAREEAPDWLKKLQAEHMPPPAPTPAPSAASQADVPDWLRQFDDTTPAAPPAAPAEQPADFGTPDWLKGLPAAPSETQAPEPPQPASAQPPALADLPDWMSSLRAQQEPPALEEAQPPSSEPIAPVELPDWISALGADNETTQQPPSSEPIAPADLPDWISSLGAEQAAPQAAESEPPASEALPPAGLPDWISSLGAQPATLQSMEPEPPASEALPPAELPDWISSLGGEQATPQQAEPEPAAGEIIPPAVLPDWLSSLGTEQTTPQSIEAQPTAGEPASPAELPDWISSLGAEQAVPQEPEPQPAPEETIFSGELPDWLSSLGTPEPAAEEPKPAAVAPEPPAAPPPAQPAQAPAAPRPALTPEAIAGEDVDAVFASMQTPDWLSAVLPSSEEPAESEPAPAAAAEEPIGPAELPSWVQAMRPVESLGAASAGGAESLTIEERGPLAGLHGVLPTIPGAGEPSSKPKPQSFKLSASEQQLAHAALLERILAAETSPIPMRTGAILRPQKVLRWVISLVMLLVLGAIVFAGTQIFALPGVATNQMPRESAAAINAVEAIPPNAPVLVVFDYQPSTVGEMEAAAGPLLDHMLVLNPPRFALLSTSPTGPALAERFMTQVLSTRAHPVADEQYVDLGYLPGGLAGVYSFAQNPTATLPLDAQLRSAWQASFLAPVHNLSDFAAIIVITDSIESGRTWIEQTALGRGNSPMVVVASAQASPMLLPYADAGQIAGMVSGLYGAVGVEQKNAGSPACVGRYEGLLAGQADAKGPSCVRRYWDAYSAGLYLAVIMVTLGALWSLWQGMRERRAQAVG